MRRKVFSTKQLRHSKLQRNAINVLLCLLEENPTGNLPIVTANPSLKTMWMRQWYCVSKAM